MRPGLAQKELAREVVLIDVVEGIPQERDGPVGVGSIEGFDTRVRAPTITGRPPAAPFHRHGGHLRASRA